MAIQDLSHFNKAITIRELCIMADKPSLCWSAKNPASVMEVTMSGKEEALLRLHLSVTPGPPVFSVIVDVNGTKTKHIFTIDLPSAVTEMKMLFAHPTQCPIGQNNLTFVVLHENTVLAKGKFYVTTIPDCQLTIDSTQTSTIAPSNKPTASATLPTAVMRHVVIRRDGTDFNERVRKGKTIIVAPGTKFFLYMQLSSAASPVRTHLLCPSLSVDSEFTIDTESTKDYNYFEVEINIHPESREAMHDVMINVVDAAGNNQEHPFHITVQNTQ